MARQGFVVYYKDFDDLDELTDAEFRALFRAIRAYSDTGELVPLDGQAAMAFKFLRRADDCDRERYEKRVKSGRGAINSRWNKDTNVYDRIPSNESYTSDTIPIPIPIPKPIPTPIPKQIPNNEEATGVTVPAKAVTPSTKSSKAKKQFEIPTVEAVAAYCKDRKNNIDPEAFWAYYDARGWKTNQGKAIERWQSCVITWEKNERERGDNNGRPHAAGGRSAGGFGSNKPDMLGTWDIDGRTIV